MNVLNPTTPLLPTGDLPTDGDVIFLAGPTPRSPAGVDWRGEAIQLFEKHSFDGTLLNPQLEQWPTANVSWLDQVSWEKQGLEEADVILFWIPREMEHMPALTTNVEFGMWVKSRKTILGAPPEAVAVDYITWLQAIWGNDGKRYMRLEEAVHAAIHYPRRFTHQPPSEGQLRGLR